MAAQLAARVARGLRSRLRQQAPPRLSAAFSGGGGAAGGGDLETDEDEDGQAALWQAALYRTGSMPAAAWVHPTLEIAVIKARSGGRAACPAASGAPPAARRPSHPSPHFSTQGKGRGVRATRDIAAGEALMAVPPAAILRSPSADEQPDVSGLPPLLAALPPPALRLLHSLHGGRGAAGAALPRFAPGLSPAAAFGLQPPPSDAGGGAAAPPTAGELQAICAANAFGDDYDDLALAALRGAPAAGHAGLWPAFSFLNHACAPNAVHFAVGGTMLVRAVSDVEAGEEVSVSYLGREAFAPERARAAALRARYGIAACGCARCALERAQPPAARAAMDAAHAAIAADLKPRLMSALEAQDGAAAAAAADGLRAALKQLRAALPAGLRRTNDEAAAALHAGVFDAFEALYYAAAAEADSDDGGMSLRGAMLPCIAALDATCRGSELHVFFTTRLLEEVVRAEGDDSAAARAAAQLAQLAVASRYGPLLNDASLMSDLADESARLAREVL